MYERFLKELKLYSRAIRVLSKGYLPISLLPPSKLEKILNEVRIAIAKSNKDYDLVLTRLYLYYDMKLVTFGIDNQRNLIVQFPVFIQPYTQKRLIMYQIETVPVPILDKNEQAHSYTELKIEKPYIALNEEMYITLHAQELKMCKRIGYKYYCKELFVIKSKMRYSCASALYFNLESDVIKANCEFQYYYNKTDIKPTVLDGRFQIILANWPNYRKIMCSHNNNIPVNIPGHPYVLMIRSILCNCDIEAESNFLLENLYTTLLEKGDNLFGEMNKNKPLMRSNVDFKDLQSYIYPTNMDAFNCILIQANLPLVVHCIKSKTDNQDL